MNERILSAQGTDICRDRISLSAFLSSMFCTLLVWQERARQRHQLAQLDARLLKDIGLARAEAEAETAKPFWRA